MKSLLNIDQTDYSDGIDIFTFEELEAVKDIIWDQFRRCIGDAVGKWASRSAGMASKGA